jgi:hypothetical protein
LSSPGNASNAVIADLLADKKPVISKILLPDGARSIYLEKAGRYCQTTCGWGEFAGNPSRLFWDLTGEQLRTQLAEPNPMALGERSIPGKSNPGGFQESVEILSPTDGVSLREPLRHSSNPPSWRGETFPRQDSADRIFGMPASTR